MEAGEMVSREQGCAVCRPGWLRLGGLFSLGCGPSCGHQTHLRSRSLAHWGFMPLILQGAEIVPALWGLECLVFLPTDRAPGCKGSGLPGSAG